MASPLFAPYLSLPDIAAACAHDMEMYGFDVKATGQRLQLDFYGAIRFVNWLRAEVAKVGPTRAAARRPRHARHLVPGARFLSDDAFLKPFMEGDVFLQNLDKYVVGKEEDDEDWSDDDGDNERARLVVVVVDERRPRSAVLRGGPSVSLRPLPMGMSVEQENQLLKQQLRPAGATVRASELAKRNPTAAAIRRKGATTRALFLPVVVLAAER